MLKNINATPSKRIYRSIISDYDLKTSVCELIDNAIDVHEQSNGGPKLQVAIDIDQEQQSIVITDNAGGVKEKELRKLISPGESSNQAQTQTIGIFGVGSKRSVVALSQEIKITTRYRKEPTFQIHYDDNWLALETWDLPYERADDIRPSSTIIELYKLRFHVSSEDVTTLGSHLGMVYAFYLIRNKIELKLNGIAIEHRSFDQWAYPPGAEPTEFVKILKTSDAKTKIEFKLTGGLTTERGSIAGDYGVYIYCNNRLIVRALKAAEVGFATGVAGVPHPKMSLARIIVELNGPASDMPWESDKAGINYNHQIFQNIRNDIIVAVKQLTKLSAKLDPSIKESIETFTIGQITKQRLKKDEVIKPSKLPKLPSPIKDFRSNVFILNKSLVEKKPWVRGLYEGVIAEDILFGQRRLLQKNRIALIILDSTLEIAFKDYLANEVSAPMSDARLETLFKNRHDVHLEIENQILTKKPIWNKIRYYYKSRCELVHKKANTTISDEEVLDYRKIVKKMLREMFGIKFPT